MSETARWITTVDEFAALQGVWNRLAGEVPFRRHEWSLIWWRHYAAAVLLAGAPRLAVITVRDPRGATIGLAPWMVRLHPLKGRVLSPIGSGEVCAEYQTILREPGTEHRVAAALAAALCDAPRVGWDRLELEAVAAGDPMIDALSAAVSQYGAVACPQPGPCTWRLALPADWESYVARLSKSHRKQLRRLQRNVLESDRAVWHTVGETCEFELGWQTLVDLHQRRRRTLGQPGCFSLPRFAAFHRELARRWLDEGRLRLHWLELDGRPAAAEYHFAGGDVVYAYQSGIEPELAGEEPGRLANIAALERAIAQGMRVFDFLRGDEPYKAHFRAEPLATCSLVLVRNAPASRLRQHVWAAARSIKRRLSAAVASPEPRSEP